MRKVREPRDLYSAEPKVYPLFFILAEKGMQAELQYTLASLRLVTVFYAPLSTQAPCQMGHWSSRFCLYDLSRKQLAANTRLAANKFTMGGEKSSVGDAFFIL